MRKWYPSKLNFVRDDVKGDDLINVDLDLLAAAKKKPDQLKSFVETLKELDQSRIHYKTDEQAEDALNATVSSLEL
jgi:hypothetical protein